ncbi:MAG TPA: sensor domain-containing diguanylate cyclase, partial [Spirochaetales bacterium]|nr:sensor domain-containing diguanylate cyclase [Spirochaetales bacterium]
GIGSESAIMLTHSLRNCVATMRPAVSTIKLKRTDGAERVVEVHQDAFQDKSDGVKGVVAVLLDVTERVMAEERLRAMAINDELTGLLNRRGYAQLATREWKRVARQELPIAALMLDIDHFKHYNDRYGHQAGDSVLRAVAACIKAGLKRPSDLAFRYGGEEFLVLLPGTDAEGARIVAERMRESVGLVRLDGIDAVSPLTVSVGVAAVVPSKEESARGDASLESLVGLADTRLYRAKETGRNRVISSDDSADAVRPVA